MEKTFNNIAGLRDLVNATSEKVEISEADVFVAGAMYELTSKSVRLETSDKDGITTEDVVGFIYDPKIAGMIKEFPAAAILLYNLGDKNYAFHDPTTGEMERSGMMGSYDPIRACRNMIAAYVGTEYERAHLFDNEDKFKEWQESTRDLKGSISRYGVSPDKYYEERKTYDPSEVYESGRMGK